MLMKTAGDLDPALPLISVDPRARNAHWPRLALFVVWAALAGWLVSRHVLWRDEVRAFSLALSGDTGPAMLRNIQGEGHPALWYLLLRGGHALTGAKQVLPGLGFAIGTAAAALFAWRAPFRPWALALAMFGAFFLHEYTAVARNYGMSMLLMFAFAALYGRWRERSVGLGVLLALLCNANVHAVLLAGALGLFWGVEILIHDGLRWTRRWRCWAANMVVALIGVAACAAEVYPPYNDAAVSPMAGRLSVDAVLWAAFNLTAPLSALVPEAWWDWPLSTLLLATMVTGSVLGLARAPAGLIAALAVTIALPLFFQVVYPGGYRHQALLVAFLLTIYWLVAEGHGGRWPARAALRPATQTALQRWGQWAFVALLATQVLMSTAIVAATARDIPYSRSRDLAALLRREGLHRAVLMANPDTQLEALPYYTDNPLWLTRERRWGQVVAFTEAAKRNLSLGELLAGAQRLRARTGRPVVIVMEPELDPREPRLRWREGYMGTFQATAAETRAFLGATRLLARFGPAQTDETYAAYLLTRS